MLIDKVLLLCPPPQHHQSIVAHPKYFNFDVQFCSHLWKFVNETLPVLTVIVDPFWWWVVYWTHEVMSRKIKWFLAVVYMAFHNVLHVSGKGMANFLLVGKSTSLAELLTYVCTTMCVGKAGAWHRENAIHYWMCGNHQKPMLWLL